MTDDKPEVDGEMFAMALCVEGLEPLRANPRALRRVFEYIGLRYLDSLRAELARVDAEIKVVQELAARKKYDVALNDPERDADTSNFA